MTCARVEEQQAQVLLGDVRDYDSVHDGLRGVNYVSCGRAKQVPSCEFYRWRLCARTS